MSERKTSPANAALVRQASGPPDPPVPPYPAPWQSTFEKIRHHLLALFGCTALGTAKRPGRPQLARVPEPTTQHLILNGSPSLVSGHLHVRSSQEAEASNLTRVNPI